MSFFGDSHLWCLGQYKPLRNIRGLPFTKFFKQLGEFRISKHYYSVSEFLGITFFLCGFFFRNGH